MPAIIPLLLALAIVIAAAKIGLNRRALRDDLPLFPSLEDLLRGREEAHRTLFAVVPDNFDVEALVAATEQVTGAFDEPDTGILFTLPITRALGLRKAAGDRSSSHRKKL